LNRLCHTDKRLLLPLLLAAVLLLPATAYAEETPVPETVPVSARETALPSEQQVQYLTDGDLASRIRIPMGTAFVWELPEGAEALRLLWHDAPKKATVRAVDAADETVGDAYAADGAYETIFPIEYGAKSIRIDAEREDAILSEIEILSAYEADGMQWQEPERVDVLVIAAHTGDEAAIFSGLIPSLSAKERTSMTVFVSCRSREARQDALDTARAYLQPYEPQFLDEKYLLIPESQKERTYKIWPENTIVAELTALIRKYRPAVVVSHAPKGEGGEGMHRMTARMVQQAVEDAANMRRERDSLAAYGIYSVPKLYLHGEPEPEKARKYARVTPTPVPAASVVLDYTANPAEGFFGQTAAEIAQSATDAYRSIRVLHKSAEPVGNYWLIRSEVGEDSGTNDLFEHIDATRLSEGVIHLPTPTPQPVETPTAQPAPTPIPQAAEAEIAIESADAEPMQTEHPLLLIVILSVTAIVGMVLIWLLIGKKMPNKTPAVLLTLLPLLFSAILSLVLLRPDAAAAAKTVSEPPAATMTPAATATPTPQPAEEPTPTKTLSPEEQKKLDWAPYFRGEDEEEEVVVFDEENGHWEYRSDTLSVLIDRKTIPELPMVYYVAHIRMLEDAFRPGFGSLDEAGSAKLEPWKLTRRARAVLAITGDNLINDEEWRKGRLIRNGIVYGEGNAQPTLAICPDMTLKIYEIDTPVEEILFSGVENTYGFGPVLVRDGRIAEQECMTHRVKGENPRAGIGMVEQGHYVAIVVDGRQPAHSIGATLVEYAQMFIDEGCTLAYNMDGGISSGMLFMGEGIHQHKSSKSKKSSGQRPWADALLFGYSELVPTEDDPIYSTGNLDEKKSRE